MSNRKVGRTEHSGAKNGGGHWGKREDAKAMSRRARRADDRVEAVRKAVEELLAAGACGATQPRGAASCGRPKGHGGALHVAYVDGRAVAAWRCR